MPVPEEAKKWYEQLTTVIVTILVWLIVALFIHLGLCLTHIAIPIIPQLSYWDCLSLVLASIFFRVSWRLII